MSKNMLPQVKSLSELRLKASNGPLAERYTQLAIIAATNLGGFGIKSLNSAMRHLNNEADAVGDDEGVVGEVNFVRDIEMARAG